MDTIERIIIGVAGESGVGKSTITDIISLFYGAENTTIISTDDLHKWERSDPIWETITHLNPDANNLELGDIHLNELSQGKSIFRSIYNHKTGSFNPPTKIEPQQIVIVEGLHAFYTDISKQIIGLKIYINTDEELKCHWKIIRDTEERGYKYNAVLDAINKRKKDGHIIRDSQIGFADIVINISPKNKIMCLGDKHEKVELSISYTFQNGATPNPLLTFIQEYISEFDTFIKSSDEIGRDVSLCQETGGNISIKIPNDLMFIKASGTKIKDVKGGNNFSVIHYSQLAQEALLVEDDDTMGAAIQKSQALKKYKRPSMETAFHVLLGKYVIHTHPIYLTLLLCLEESQKIITELFSDLNYGYVEYSHPGFYLYKRIQMMNETHPIYFLENHGVIISSDSMDSCLELLRKMNDKAKNYIKENCEFQEFELSFADVSGVGDFIFPDAIVFAKDSTKLEVLAAHNYIASLGSKLGKLRYLSQDAVHFLQHMEAEKYRTTL